jgi:hypothetical protein
MVNAGDEVLSGASRADSPIFEGPPISVTDIQDVLVYEGLCRISGTPVAVSKTRFKVESSDYINSMLDNLDDD